MACIGAVTREIRFHPCIPPQRSAAPQASCLPCPGTISWRAAPGSGLPPAHAAHAPAHRKKAGSPSSRFHFGCLMSSGARRIQLLRPCSPSVTSSTVQPSNGMPTLVSAGAGVAALPGPGAAVPAAVAASVRAAPSLVPPAPLATSAVPCCLAALLRPGDGGLAPGGGTMGRNTRVPCARLPSHARNGCDGSHEGGQLPSVSVRRHTDAGAVYTTPLSVPRSAMACGSVGPGDVAPAPA